MLFLIDDALSVKPNIDDDEDDDDDDDEDDDGGDGKNDEEGDDGRFKLCCCCSELHFQMSRKLSPSICTLSNPFSPCQTTMMMTTTTTIMIQMLRKKTRRRKTLSESFPRLLGNDWVLLYTFVVKSKGGSNLRTLIFCLCLIGCVMMKYKAVVTS